MQSGKRNSAQQCTSRYCAPFPTALLDLNTAGNWPVTCVCVHVERHSIHPRYYSLSRDRTPTVFLVAQWPLNVASLKFVAWMDESMTESSTSPSVNVPVKTLNGMKFTGTKWFLRCTYHIHHTCIIAVSGVYNWMLLLGSDQNFSQPLITANPDSCCSDSAFSEHKLKQIPILLTPVRHNSGYSETWSLDQSQL